jgi:hypothetical protein
VSGEARGRTFDALATEMASGTLSRGRMLKLMGAALVGGTLGSLGGVAAADEDEDEECKPLNKKCRKNHQCCSGKCAAGKCAPACTSNGETCTSGTQCCSGNCKDGSCVASCIPPNAIPCDATNPGSCPGGLRGGCTCVDEASGGAYCSSGGSAIPCTTSCDCPTGQYCQPFGGGNLCTRAADMCPRV